MHPPHVTLQSLIDISQKLATDADRASAGLALWEARFSEDASGLRAGVPRLGTLALELQAIASSVVSLLGACDQSLENGWQMVRGALLDADDRGVDGCTGTSSENVVLAMQAMQRLVVTREKVRSLERRALISVHRLEIAQGCPEGLDESLVSLLDRLRRYAS